MNFSIESKTLYSTLSALGKVINSKNALSILNNFLFSLNDSVLTVRATDMENSLVATLEVMDAEGAGSFCLDARRMLDLLKEMPSQVVAFNINDDTLETIISYSNGEFKIVAFSAKDYPSPMNEADSDPITFSCPSSVAISGIENTIFAVGTDALRPQMTGILWDIKPDGIIFVGTDTRKLVRYTNKLVAPGATCSFILPQKAATVLRGLFGKEESIDVCISKASVTFSSATYRFDCRFIKGNFPNYDRVIPTNNPNVLTIDRQSFVNAMRRVTIFGSGGVGLVRFHFEGNIATLNAQDSNFGTSGSESVACDYNGEALTIGFGAPTLQEILGTIATPEVIIQLGDPSRPALCLPSENCPDTDLTIVLMPMQLGD